jgi:type III restriction enzyme
VVLAMADVVIDNPIINSPFDEPTRHFRFGEEGITNEVVEERRVSSYFMPIPAAKKRMQLHFDTEWTRDRIEENQFINQVRGKVGLWRRGRWQGVTPTTRRLLEHWTASERERRLFFCQVEAVETAIYLAEAATKYGDAWITDELRRFAEDANPGLFRVALKMATGSGKTVVMGMLIAWQTLNKLASPQDARFSDSFLIVTPGITIRDRLRVLLPQDTENYYRVLDLVPAAERERLGQARIVIANYHAFQLRETTAASKTTKALLARDGESPFTETPEQMVRRVCRELGTKKNVVVLNDEAHHCYRRRAGGGDGGGEEKLTGEDRREAERRDSQARQWISGLEAIQRRLGIRAVYDLSATPFFLHGSGYREGTLFPWVVSDFSLIDAIESGIVKIPRVPVADDAMTGEQPTYRDLWPRIRERLPRKGRSKATLGEEPNLPPELQGALHSLYGNYEQAFKQWQASEAERPTGTTPPVFIVVCNNTSVSKLVFDYVAGWAKTLQDGSTVVVPGELAIFSNERDGSWSSRPNTVLVDSEQLESGDSMSAEFKALARTEIEEFKAEYRARFPGRDAEELTDEDLLREVMNTVGKPGKLGEQVRCVVSVSMLTEGWDANTVTHILGVRAFGTQLLCEQVVGRGLRRRSYTVNDEGRFDPEYAEVYGVPFSFIPAAGSASAPSPGLPMTRVRALAERAECEIYFPRIIGYRHELTTERLHVKFDQDARLALSTQDIPSTTELSPIVGVGDVHTLDDLRTRRYQEVVYFLARRVTQRYFADRPWLFPQVVEIVCDWMGECVTLKDHTFIGMLLLHQHADDAADRIYRAIIAADPGERALIAVPSYDGVGSTRYVDFDTTKPVMSTDPERCHVSHVVADSGWEHKLAQALEEMPEVRCYVKNKGLGFTIPYTINGEQHPYFPDFIVRIDDGHGEDDLLSLIVEVSGAQRRDKEAKVATVRSLWVPAVNNLATQGRWAFVECEDPWDAERLIRGKLAELEPMSA